MDLASLNIKVTQSGVQEGAAGLARITKEGKGAAQTVDAVEKSAKKTGGTMSAFNRVINESIFSFKNLIGTYAVLRTINMADQFVLLQGRVQQSTRSVEEANYAWKELLATAKETGADVGAAVSVFQRISFVRDEIKATTDEMLQFTETVQKLGLIGGASQESLKFGLTQLGQSLSSDIVRAEEFNSIMENIPSVGRAIADELGVTTGQLRLLVIEGKLLSSDVFAAILNQTDKANEKFEQMPETVGRAFSRLMTGLMEMVGGLNEASGATAVLIFGMEKVGKILEIIGNLAEGSFYFLSSLYTDILGSVMSLIQAMLKGLQDLINLGINGANYFRKDKISAVDFTGGVSSSDIVSAQSDISAGLRAKSGKAFGDNVQAGKELFGFGTSSTDQEKESSTRKISQNYADIAKNMGDGNKEEEKAQKLIAKTIADLKFKNEQMGRSIEDQELYNELRSANVEIDSAAGKQIEELVRIHQALEQEQKNLKTIVDAGESAFKKLWMGATKGGTDWRDTMRSIVDDVQEMFYDLVVKSQLQNLFNGIMGPSSSSSSGLFGSLLSGVSGLFGGGVTASSFAASQTANISSGLYGPGFADGGSFRVGGIGGTDSQQVSFRASPDETVSITRPGQNGGGGGVTNHYSIDARGADAGVEERLLRALSALDKSVESRALNAVDNTFKRNPKFGRRA